MTTASDLIQATRQHLFTGQPEILNRLSGALNATDVTFATVYDFGTMNRGSIIEIDLEQIYIYSVTVSSKTVTDCIRGFNGTTAASHSANAVITIAPKFPASRILQAINDDLRDLSSPINGLYRVLVEELIFNAAQSGYDMPGASEILSIAEIRYRVPGPALTWPRIESYALLRNMINGDFLDFPSGFGLVIYDDAYPGFPIQVRYRAPYSQLALLGDDVTQVSGLQATALDLPPLGAAIRVAAGREVKRNFDEAQGEPRRAEEVPPQAVMGATRELLRIRQARINAEAARLQATYSYEMVG
jgi:hypothetical protein